MRAKLRLLIERRDHSGETFSCCQNQRRIPTPILVQKPFFAAPGSCRTRVGHHLTAVFATRGSESPTPDQ